MVEESGNLDYAVPWDFLWEDKVLLRDKNG